MFKRIFAILIVVTGLQMLLVGLLTSSSGEDQHPSSGEAAPNLSQAISGQAYFASARLPSLRIIRFPGGETYT